MADPRIIIAGLALIVALAGGIALFALGQTEGALTVLATMTAPAAYLYGLHDTPPGNNPTDGSTPDDTPPV